MLKPDLSDDMLDVWDEAGADEVDTAGDVTLESWTGFSRYLDERKRCR